MDKIKATKALYIKLGKGGEYEEESFKHDDIRLGYHDIDDSIGHDYEKIRNCFLGNNRKAGSASNHANQVHAFYTEPEDTIWVTFSRGMLWWCQAKEGVKMLGKDPRSDGAKGSRFRETINGWHNKDIKGNPLNMIELSGNLTKTAGYRGTICSIREEFNYLLCKINGETPSVIANAEEAENNMMNSICELMKMLQPEDFELLVELVFARSGWQRISATGGTQKFIDIEMMLPSTEEKAIVQVKSQGKKGELKRYIDNFAEYKSTDKFFYVYHSNKDVNLEEFESEDYENIYIIDDRKLSRMVLNAGLFNWLLNRISY